MQALSSTGFYWLQVYRRSASASSANGRCGRWLGLEKTKVWRCSFCERFFQDVCIWSWDWLFIFYSIINSEFLFLDSVSVFCCTNIWVTEKGNLVYIEINHRKKRSLTKYYCKSESQILVSFSVNACHCASVLICKFNISIHLILHSRSVVIGLTANRALFRMSVLYDTIGHLSVD